MAKKCGFSRPRETESDAYIQEASKRHKAYTTAAKGFRVEQDLLKRPLTSIVDPIEGKKARKLEIRQQDDKEAESGGKIVIVVQGDDNLRFVSEFKMRLSDPMSRLLKAYAKAYSKANDNRPLILRKLLLEAGTLANGYYEINLFEDTCANLGLEHRDVVQARERHPDDNSGLSLTRSPVNPSLTRSTPSRPSVGKGWTDNEWAPKRWQVLTDYLDWVDYSPYNQDVLDRAWQHNQDVAQVKVKV